MTSNGDTLQVLGISGSLRKDSRNSAILRAAIRLAPEGMTVTSYPIGNLPFYDTDVESEGDPPEVLAFKQAISDADGVLFVTPEYNYGLTGVQKNAIDWANRGPAGKRGARTSAMALKPVFVMGGSSQYSGSSRAQTQLREAMIEPGALVYSFPQVLMGRFQDRLDESGELADQLSLDFIALALEAFGSWIRLVGARSDSPYRRHLEEIHAVDPRTRYR